MSTKMIELNLLPLEYRERLKPKSKKLGLDIPQFIPLAVVGLVAVLVGINMLSYLHKKSYLTKFSALSRTAKQTKSNAERARELEELIPKLRERDQHLKAKVEKKLLCWKVMREISKWCPAGIRIRDMKISSKEGINSLMAEGSYKSDAGAYMEELFRTNLEKSEVLRDFFKKFRAERNPGPDGIITFTIFGSSKL